MYFQIKLCRGQILLSAVYKNRFRNFSGYVVKIIGILFGAVLQMKKEPFLKGIRIMKKLRCLLTFTIMTVVVSVGGNTKVKSNEAVSQCEYTIEKEEILTKDSTQATVAELSFEVPVFQNDGYEMITEAMNKKKEEFFEENEELFSLYVSDGEESDYREGYFPYYCTSSLGEIYSMNGYCSVQTTFDWYAGGTASHDLIPYNFSVETGEEITLDEVVQIQNDELKKIIWSELDRQGIEYDDFTEATIDAYEIDEFHFYFDETGINIVFMTGEISYNAVGCITIPVGSI